jgi:DNA-binding NarL/FixJ family response regulator
MKILLIDDHPLFREGMALLLEPLVRELGEDLEAHQVGTCEEAFALLEARGAVDMVMIDIVLPGMSGIDGLRILRERYPQTPLVALSSSDDKATVLEAIDAGAMGFIPKSSSKPVLIGALHLIMAKGIYLPPLPFLGGSTLPALQPAAAPRPAASAAPGCLPAQLGITPRQADVLYEILQGKSVKLIGRDLGLSPSTVKAHTSAVLRALNVTTRTQAVVAAARIGLHFDERRRGHATAS